MSYDSKTLFQVVTVTDLDQKYTINSESPYPPTDRIIMQDCK